MKFRLSLLFLVFACALPARADEVALMQVRMGASGDILPVAFSFYEGEAPATVANFKKLARKKFYDGCAFHRAFPHTLVQVGDPLSRKKDRTKAGTGGPRYTLLPEVHHRHGLGDVAMARLPDKINPSRVSNGSQFFVCLVPMPEYDGKYTVFAHVLYGLDTLDRISAMSVDSNDSPIDRVTVKSLRILPREALPPAPVPGAKKPVKRSWWKIW